MFYITTFDWKVSEFSAFYIIVLEYHSFVVVEPLHRSAKFFCLNFLTYFVSRFIVLIVFEFRNIKMIYVYQAIEHGSMWIMLYYDFTLRTVAKARAVR